MYCWRSDGAALMQLKNNIARINLIFFHRLLHGKEPIHRIELSCRQRND
ncbi:MAG: hypothetical protein ACD_42C00341G0001, partial [uncultured bacterium]